ncbi:23S rRNA (uracil(1939)-C(5))-methyltransferase RlmD [Negativibacillus massiliensis]|uniref:23S rRNA (uracil(1939)-C(5))-methyltransferase RlmD n=2 Tax=Negativibacillus massiliensis TaxID=1871035 RepID=UPI00097606D8|nr:23S rRNA (uracil(1939)-C(5))-methyltransferase RlmD [Negativibacillus massiliensis]
MLKKNQIEEAEITAMSSDGNGIAKIDGMVVFVPYTAVGDKLKIRIVKVQKNYSFGIIEEILQPSPDRVDDHCPVYKKCGGCAFRHISYEAELRHKAEFVQSNLRRLGGLDPVMLPITPSPLVQGYRNKAQYPIREYDGKIEAGFFAKRSHRVISCASCDLQPAFFEQILEYTKQFLEEYHISAYDEQTGKGKVRHLYIRYGEVSGEVMVCLVVNSERLPHAAEYVEGLLKVCPQVVSVVLNINREQNNVILGQKCITLYGKDTIEDTLCDVRFELSPLSFYQVNRQAAEKLYRLAAEMAQFEGNELLIDLYCGAGTIGLSMASKVRELIGVEIVPDAVENAKENAKRCGVENARFICADAKEAAAQLAAENLHPDVIVVDPPRKGCDLEVLQAIAAMAPKRLVMISCNSASLARDCKELEALGYHLEKAAPVDLFPRTTHVETVVLLSQQKPDDTIEIDLDLDELDATSAELKATYQEIKDYVLKEFGLKVSSLYISQVKRKCGIEVGENYNLPKSENARVPQCPKEKEDAIKAALKYYAMI